MLRQPGDMGAILVLIHQLGLTPTLSTTLTSDDRSGCETAMTLTFERSEGMVDRNLLNSMFQSAYS